jgi:hypothetical protein
VAGPSTHPGNRGNGGARHGALGAAASPSRLGVCGYCCQPRGHASYRLSCSHAGRGTGPPQSPQQHPTSHRASTRRESMRGGDQSVLVVHRSTDDVQLGSREAGAYQGQSTSQALFHLQPATAPTLPVCAGRLEGWSGWSIHTITAGPTAHLQTDAAGQAGALTRASLTASACVYIAAVAIRAARPALRFVPH